MLRRIMNLGLRTVKLRKNTYTEYKSISNCFLNIYDTFVRIINNDDKASLYVNINKYRPDLLINWKHYFFYIRYYIYILCYDSIHKFIKS